MNERQGALVITQNVTNSRFEEFMESNTITANLKDPSTPINSKQ